MKTAISIPDPLFGAAERLAKHLGISRSQLYQRALQAFLQEQEKRRLAEAPKASAAKGVRFSPRWVTADRKRLGLSQARFAARFGFALDAVRNWEQGRRQPDVAARAFLMVIDREPDAVTRALSVPGREKRRAGRKQRPARRAAGA